MTNVAMIAGTDQRFDVAQDLKARLGGSVLDGATVLRTHIFLEASPPVSSVLTLYFGCLMEDGTVVTAAATNGPFSRPVRDWYAYGAFSVITGAATADKIYNQDNHWSFKSRRKVHDNDTVTLYLGASGANATVNGYVRTLLALP